MQLYLKSGSDEWSKVGGGKKLVCVSPRTINYVLGVVVELEQTALASELADLLTRYGYSDMPADTHQLERTQWQMFS